MAAVTTPNENQLREGDDGPDERLPASATAAKPSFFSVYKSGQGVYTRYGTGLGAAILITVFALFAYEQARTYATNGRAIPTAITAAVVAIGAIVCWRIINAPKNVDFLISTDSEMKKVAWPSREELFGSTRIVIIFLFIIALLLFLIDVAAGAFFQAIHLLKFGILG